MHLDIPENKKLKLEPDQYHSDVEDNYSDYIKSNNPELDVEKKKRRGKIEKRRRDRINNSLAELKELVPNAIAKQNTTKLEKAEILKLAVDHLKELKSKDSSKGYGGYTSIYESKIAGFRDCLNEVSKYLHREGITTQNPLYQGLMEHLQYFYQCILSQTPYQIEAPSAIDSAFRYSQMQTPLITFDPNTVPNYHENYQKLTSWSSNAIASSYQNQPNHYQAQTSNYQSNFLFQRNAHQQYPTNIATPLIAANANPNSVFKCSSTPSRISLTTNPSQIQPLIQQPSGLDFPSFCNDSINFFQSRQEIP